METRTLVAQCHCKAIHYKVSIPSADLPLPVHLCHCTICRRSLGTLCAFHTNLPAGTVPEWIRPSSEANLSGYKFARAESEQLFCSTCGCHVGDTGTKDGEPVWTVSTSIFRREDVDAFRITAHMDGTAEHGTGLFTWLPNIGDREMTFCSPTVNGGKGRAGPPPPKLETGEDGRERLRAECHCGGVSFTFPRPTKETLEDAALKKFVSPFDPAKWIGSLDVCDDCRLVSGVHVNAWTFVPLSVCQPHIGPDLRIGTSKTYASSDEVLRSFCGTCGATVFYADKERLADGRGIADLAVGVLRAPEGVAAEDWLSWRTGRMSWAASGLRYDASLYESLKKGMETWGIREFGDKRDFKIG